MLPDDLQMLDLLPRIAAHTGCNPNVIERRLNIARDYAKRACDDYMIINAGFIIEDESLQEYLCLPVNFRLYHVSVLKNRYCHNFFSGDPSLKELQEKEMERMVKKLGATPPTDIEPSQFLYSLFSVGLYSPEEVFQNDDWKTNYGLNHTTDGQLEYEMLTEHWVFITNTSYNVLHNVRNEMLVLGHYTVPSLERKR